MSSNKLYNRINNMDKKVNSLEKSLQLYAENEDNRKEVNTANNNNK